MSNAPSGPGWWQASDDRWYPPETHPDYRAPGQTGSPGQAGTPQPKPVEGFAPPSADQRYPTPFDQPPADLPKDGPGESHRGPGQYPSPAGATPPNRSSGKVLAIIFGAVFLLLVGGCGLFAYSFRDEIADAAIDFSDSVQVEVEDEATCSVLGVGFSGNYEIEATLTAADSVDESHYQLSFQVVDEDGTVIGEDMTVFRSMASGERRAENAFNVIVAEVDVDAVSCTVTEVRRVSV